MTRITGLATGLDVDTIVKQTMQAYQSKIDTQKQKKDVVEIKQQLYRDIIKEAQELYNKHFDILKEGSLIKSSTWQSVTFKSSDPDLLTVIGSSSSKLGNYTVEKGQIAKAAYITKTSEKLGNEITINGQVFKVTGANDKEKAGNLNKALTKAGVNVAVKYTQFLPDGSQSQENKGIFLFESKTLGENSNFTIGKSELDTKSEKGSNAKGAEIIGLKVKDLINNIDTSFDTDLNDNINIGKVHFSIGNDNFEIDIAKGSSNDEVQELLNKAVSKNGYTSKVDDDGNITFITIKTGSGVTNPDSIKIKEGSSEQYYTIDITKDNFKDGIDAKSAKDIDIGTLENINRISVNGVYINLENIIPNDEAKGITIQDKINHINKALTDNNISLESVKAVEDNGKIILKSTIKGENSKIEFSNLNDVEMSKGGQDAEINISNGSGTYTHKGNSNTFVVDDITFKFTGEIPDSGITVSSSQDSSKIIENIKQYIEDYNSLMIKINTLTSEKRDRNYQPLTDAQKKEMTDKEIEVWEAKVKQGQLKGDSDLRRISSALRQGMTSLVSESGLTLELIGIESVNDYGGTKDGTFKINEATLKEALENNMEEIAKVFTQSTTDTSNQKGIMIRLKEILYDETVSSKSILSKKVGFEGTTTVSNNTLSKQMQEYQKKIDQMNSLFATKEQDLYSQYAKLETIMNNYNSQMNYLSQSLGLS